MIIIEKLLKNKKTTYIVKNNERTFEISTDYFDYEVNGIKYRTIIRTNTEIKLNTISTKNK